MIGPLEAAYLAGAATTVVVWDHAVKNRDLTSDLVLAAAVAAWPLTWAWALYKLFGEATDE